jgi:hypothetical protein
MVPPRTPSFGARIRVLLRSGENVSYRAVVTTVLVTPLLLGALAVPSGGLFRAR